MLTMIRHHDDTYAYEPLTRRWSTPRLDYEQAPAHEKLDLHTRVAAASVRTAVITGLAAGILHHIPILNHTNQVVVHLTLPGRQQPPPRSQWENSILRYRYAVLPDTDICLIGGNRVTTLARTFTDICTINGELEVDRSTEVSLKATVSTTTLFCRKRTRFDISRYIRF